MNGEARDIWRNFSHFFHRFVIFWKRPLGEVVQARRRRWFVAEYCNTYTESGYRGARGFEISALVKN